jgi:hypothetical protein
MSFEGLFIITYAVQYTVPVIEIDVDMLFWLEKYLHSLCLVAWGS